MSLATLLVFLAGIMFLLDVVLWNTVATWRRHLLTPIGGLLLVIAWLISSGAIH